MGPFKKLRKTVNKIINSRSNSKQVNLVSEEEVHSEIQQGRYILPAESDHHEATILGFPSRTSLPPDKYDAVCVELAELAVAIAEFEPVRIYVRPDDKSLLETLLSNTTKDISRVTIIICPINHCWVRDTGPIYVRDATGRFPDRRFAIDFRFNEWGGKKPDSDGLFWGQRWPPLDDKDLQENTDFARWVIDHDTEPSPVTRIESPIRAEGGAFVTDGDGTLLMTESSAVCDVRNPGMSKARIESELKRLLGVDKVIWFPGRLNADITDVHMDAEARFIRPGVVLFSKPHDVAPDLWKEISAEIWESLIHEKDAKGRSLEIYTIQEPDPRGLTKTDEEELSARYVNFYFVNGGLIIPKFGDEERDQHALEILSSLMPDRVIRQVYANAIPLTGGGLHCVTQQVPTLK
ncbi:Peptidyl-arginine deiminase Porphyromonas-type [Penicillium angulare]|uniref:Peptidyl-arginine deiminase Porphyromonas-type n=1 Tax=Penicillium angulare TaxID=116970 RepID=A0A9W9K6S2_9EURO|nr:Peptidyl-arginine deiminase Porphyromonas-type [Penicillium angulare]